jgi:hypothetical protein
MGKVREAAAQLVWKFAGEGRQKGANVEQKN